MVQPAPASREVQRSLLARHLVGNGLELGPGHVPFPITYPGTQVRYVDRWQPDENHILFPELGDAAPFLVPDVISNFDTDGLQAVDDTSEDFVIASHVFEHVANPLALLEDVHRVLRPGGVLLLLLPDRRRTFDRYRPATTLVHLLDEYGRGADHVDDDHVLEFLVGTDVPVPDDPLEREAVFALHRRRSIHVHCWHEEEFMEVLVHSVTALGHRWELVDAVLADDEGEDGFEFGYVLRRATVPADAEILAERLSLAWLRWHEHRVWVHSHVDVVRSLGTGTSPVQAPTTAAHPPGVSGLAASLRRRVGILRVLLVNGKQWAASSAESITKRRRQEPNT